MDERRYTVYVHTSPSNKKYVGMTSTSLEKRWQSGKGYRTQVFYRAIQKYGWDNIEHEVVQDGLTKSEAEELERALIKEYKSNNPHYGYNVADGGHHAGMHSEATRKKFSERMKGSTLNRGRVHTELARKHMSEAQRKVDHHLTEEQKRHLSEINKGRTYSEESIEKMRQSARRLRSYPVYCVELDMTFDSVPEASEYIESIGGHVIRQGIQKVVNGVMSASGNLEDGTRLHWKKVEN